jgi:hypothetical protein
LSNVRFIDVARDLGLTVENVCGSFENRYILESLGSGAGWLDFDGDGDLDLYVVNGSRLDPPTGGKRPANQMYRNDGEGGFKDVAEETGVADERWGIGCAVGDVDNDGDCDLYVSNFGRNRLYLNVGDSFTDGAVKSAVADERMSTSCAFGDHDNDGDLDLYVANYLKFDPASPPNGGKPCHWYAHPVYCGPDGLSAQPDGLYSNDGSGNFVDVSAQAGVDGEVGYGLGVVFGDYDADGDADIYVANDSSPNFLFQNQADGTFAEVAIVSGVGHSEDGQEQAGMGVAFGDYDNDGDQDLFVTNFSDDYNTLYRNESGSFFRDVSALAGLLHTSVYSLGWGTEFADFDNDGYLDLFVANGHVYPQADGENTNTAYRQQNQLFRGTANGRFQEVTQFLGRGLATPRSSRGTAVADYDGDGDLDVFIVNEGAPPTLLENATDNWNRWVRIRLRGVTSNREGIGALLRIRTDSGTRLREVRRGTGYASSRDPVVHFGVGSDDTIRRLDVTWPGGGVQEFHDLPTQKLLVITEGSAVPGIE